jgi:hypothetical protein
MSKNWDSRTFECPEKMILLDDLNALTLYRLGDYLDHKFDGEFMTDWSDVAKLFQFTKVDIANMGLALKRGGKCTEELMHMISRQYPDCTAGELINKCEIIGRDDAANYLKSAVVDALRPQMNRQQ